MATSCSHYNLVLFIDRKDGKLFEKSNLRLTSQSRAACVESLAFYTNQETKNWNDTAIPAIVVLLIPMTTYVQIKPTPNNGV